MLEPIIQAIEAKNYRTASQLLKTHLQNNPQDLWAQFYWGYLRELAGQREPAEKIYRSVLKQTTNRKLTQQARQAIQRLHDTEKQQRQQAIAQARAVPENAIAGCLVLEPVDANVKTRVAEKFARLWNLDAYTARLHLPSRGWRFYRTGAIGELQVYRDELAAIGVPSFCATLQQIQAIEVFRVEQIKMSPQNPQAIATCRSADNRSGELSFQWSEVKQWVEGALPILESVVDVDAWNRLIRKDKTQDYAQILDLHLPGRACILRCFDQTYQFHPKSERLNQPLGLASPLSGTTNRQNWNQLLATMQASLSTTPRQRHFKIFADSALDFAEFLKLIHAQVDLLRHKETLWDEAFHLYSTLNFARLEPARLSVVNR
jgi:hypothetical protein